MVPMHATNYVLLCTNILPTRGALDKTIPDRREFYKLIESGSRVIDFGRFLHPGTLMYQAGSRVGI